MGRVFIDGFESGNLGLWEGISGATVAAAQTGMDGSYNAYISGSTQYFEKAVGKTELYVAFRIRMVSFNTYNGIVLSFRENGGTNIGALRMSAAGSLYVTRGSGLGTTLASAPTALQLATTYKIEVRYKPDNTTGIFQVKVDGLTVMDFSGDTTDGPTSIGSARFGYYSGTTETCPFNGYIDNVVMDDTGWPGDTRIAAVKPSGVGNSAQWTPSTGNNWDCVDEVPPSDTDYLTTNTTGNKDTYGATDLPADASTVKCVQFAARIQKEGAPTPTKLAFVIRTGATDYEGSGKNLPTALTVHVTDLWVNNPATSSPFTPSEVNGMEIGIKAVA